MTNTTMTTSKPGNDVRGEARELLWVVAAALVLAMLAVGVARLGLVRPLADMQPADMLWSQLTA